MHDCFAYILLDFWSTFFAYIFPGQYLLKPGPIWPIEHP